MRSNRPKYAGQAGVASSASRAHKEELCIELGEAITSRQCRSFLSTFSGSSKSAKAAKRLLRLEEEDRAADSRRAAAVHALRAQLELS